jgi:hypothetical protein
MDGSSTKGRGLVVQRGWIINRMAGQFQSDAYRLAAPPPPCVRTAMQPMPPMPPMPPSALMNQNGGAIKIETIESQNNFSRMAAGGRS